MSYPSPSSTRVRELQENIQAIRAEMAAASSSISSNKKPTLVLVSKLKPPSDLMAAYENLAQDERHFGENYVQELVDKAKLLPSDIKWHFIGGLQSNKCKTLASIPNLYAVETLDSVKKADLFEKALAADADTSRKLNVYIQVNTSGEDAKSGLAPLSSSKAQSEGPDTLLGLAKHILEKCAHLHLQGLMTIGAIQSSYQAKEGEENPDFTCLRECRDLLSQALGGKELQLSMGMSNDFAAAIKAGSDSVRVGSRLFGERPSKEEAKKQREAQQA